MVATARPRANPYVGPRAFTFNDKDRFYGRDREVRELLDLLLAERFVLLYSPSGAGKTSLIEAGLKPLLEREEDFHLFRTMRVSLAPARLPPGANRFALSLLLSLQEESSPDFPNSTDEFADLSRLTLDEFLNREPKREHQLKRPKREVLIFDQFEEILTIDPTANREREEFFEQVGEALNNRQRWALFSMREEYRAALDPYLRPIPTRLSVTFRLDLLGVAAAHEAIQQPAAGVGVEFTKEAAGNLVDDLRKVRVPKPDGKIGLELGPYIEPVQLQVVCLSLWDKWIGLSPATSRIEAGMVAQVGDVDSALADYYALQVKTAAASSKTTTERAIRDWFKDQLITTSGIRGQVLAESITAAGLEKSAIDHLDRAHIIRAETRRNIRWYELAHDRLIEPVQTNNKQWYDAYLTLLQRQAELWDRNGGRKSSLLRGSDLTAEEQREANRPELLSATERAFLKASQEERQAVIQEHEQEEIKRQLEARKQRDSVVRRWLIVTSIISLLAVSFLTLSVFNYFRLRDRSGEVIRQRTLVERQKNELETKNKQLNEQLESMQQSKTQFDELKNEIKSSSLDNYPVINKLDQVEQKLDAGTELSKVYVQQSNIVNLKEAITVRYLENDVDQKRVDGALRGLKFELDKKKSPESVENVPTNCIWYGNPNLFDDAKLVAFALISAGVKVQGIVPSKTSNTMIQIGGSARVVNCQPMTVDQIKACKEGPCRGACR